MSYKNITIKNKDGNTYHPETNISNILGIDKKADKDYVDKKLNKKIDKSELDKVKQSGVEINKILVDALNSKEVLASTSDSIKENVKKVEDIEANYDWKKRNLLHHSNFIDGWSKWSENQNVMLDKTKDNGLKVIFNQTNSTPGLRRKEADIMLDSLPKTLSFLVKQSNPSNHTIAYFFDKNGNKVEEGPRLTSYKEKGYTKYIMNFSLPKTDNYQLMILTNSPKSKGDYMIVKDIMIENGKEANAYRPFTLRERDYKGNFTKTLTKQGDFINLSEGYYDRGHIKANILNLKPENIKAGVNVGGVIGTYNPFGLNVPLENGVNIRLFPIDDGFSRHYLPIAKGKKVVSGTAKGEDATFDVMTGTYTGRNHHFDTCEYKPSENVIYVRTYNWKGSTIEFNLVIV